MSPGAGLEKGGKEIEKPKTPPTPPSTRCGDKCTSRAGRMLRN